MSSTADSTRSTKVNNKLIVLYDGVCNLCNRAVVFILKHEKGDDIRFASLQSGYAKKIKRDLNIAEDYLESFVFIEGDEAFFKSTAVLKVSKYLKGLYPLASYLQYIPKFMRDPVYDFIAKYRYRLFGKKDKCTLPSEEQRSRFLDI